MKRTLARAHALHALAIGMTRVLAPPRALRALRRVGASLGPIDAAEARWLTESLEPFGTCLSRALAIAAWLPEAEVVLGATRPLGDFRAHAWVEFKRRPLTPYTRIQHELARFG